MMTQETTAEISHLASEIVARAQSKAASIEAIESTIATLEAKRVQVADALAADEAEARARISALVAEADATKAAADDAKAQAVDIVGKARDEAADILLKAQRRADQIVQNAQKSAATIKRAAAAPAAQ